MHSNPFAHSVPFRILTARANRQCHLVAWLIAGAVLASWTQSSSAGDWPQILGPNRDGQADAAQPLPVDWPKTLQPRWSYDLGSGYAGAAIVNDVVYIPHRINAEELLDAIDLKSGKQLWRASWKATYNSSIDADSGPRCVPTLSGNQAICYGAAGDLVSVRTSDGRINWSRSLRQELNADDGYFGAGSSPLVVDDIVVVVVGAPTAGILGVDLKTGATKWSATKYDASYAAPVLLNQKGKSGKPLALVVTRLNTVVLDTGDGTVLSDVRFGSRGPTVNAATPILIAPDSFLLTASYGIGALVVDVTNGKMTETVRDTQLLSSQYNTPVRIGNRVIGVQGREDSAPASLRAIAPLQRQVQWEHPGLGTAHLIAVGTQVLLTSVKGKIILLDGSSPSYKVLAEGMLAGNAFRALPALSGNTLIVRDSIDGKNSKCIAVQFGKE